MFRYCLCREGFSSARWSVEKEASSLALPLNQVVKAARTRMLNEGLDHALAGRGENQEVEDGGVENNAFQSTDHDISPGLGCEAETDCRWPDEGEIILWDFAEKDHASSRNITTRALAFATSSTSTTIVHKSEVELVFLQLHSNTVNHVITTNTDRVTVIRCCIEINHNSSRSRQCHGRLARAAPAFLKEAPLFILHVRMCLFLINAHNLIVHFATWQVSQEHALEFTGRDGDERESCTAFTGRQRAASLPHFDPLNNFRKRRLSPSNRNDVAAAKLEVPHRFAEHRLAFRVAMPHDLTDAVNATSSGMLGYDVCSGRIEGVEGVELVETVF
mmetsp:Transcript_10803/g.24589  ORF Transcript_10803/g.24589 Transcript_10803/m.24589 type:complete len:332 (+) Transcript_10803:543-1538(+)